MKFEDFKRIYISLDYLEAMYKVDSEVFFVNNSEYERKPHLGILINESGRKYIGYKENVSG